MKSFPERSCTPPDPEQEILEETVMMNLDKPFDQIMDIKIDNETKMKDLFYEKDVKEEIKNQKLMRKYEQEEYQAYLKEEQQGKKQ